MRVQARIQMRRATAAEWLAANPILEDGEAGAERDTRRVKLGDGVTAWVALPYIFAGEQGMQGVQGVQGAQGERGLQGVQGVAGAAGAMLRVAPVYLASGKCESDAFSGVINRLVGYQVALSDFTVANFLDGDANLGFFVNATRARLLSHRWVSPTVYGWQELVVFSSAAGIKRWQRVVEAGVFSPWVQV